MSVLKVVEIMANSNQGWEDASRKAVKQAGKTIKNIRSVYVKDQAAVVNNDEITEYRVTLKITFEVN
ncbi:dodecin family protein [Salegentibacter sp. HM20]